MNLLGNIDGLRLAFEPEWARSNWQSYCVRLPDRVDQRTVMQNLLDQEIATRRGIMCSHLEAPYASETQRHDLCQSELARDQAILLPLYAQMSEDDQSSCRDCTARRTGLLAVGLPRDKPSRVGYCVGGDLQRKGRLRDARSIAVSCGLSAQNGCDLGAIIAVVDGDRADPSLIFPVQLVAGQACDGLGGVRKPSPDRGAVVNGPKVQILDPLCCLGHAEAFLHQPSSE